jgi:chromosome segregation ATPase
MKRILGLLLALYVPAASAVYKCTDEKGLTLFGDTPPAGCGNVPIYEIGPGGHVVRRLDPTPTPEQVKERALEEARAKKAALAAAEQKRKDMALLNSYSSAEEFDVARDRNIEPVAGRIASARDRMTELDKREEEINERMAALREEAKSKKGADEPFEPPAWLSANLERVHKERSSITTGIARYRKEIDELRAKYESDKQRWMMLKANKGILEVQGGAVAETPKAPAKDSKGY